MLVSLIPMMMRTYVHFIRQLLPQSWSILGFCEHMVKAQMEMLGACRT